MSAPPTFTQADFAAAMRVGEDTAAAFETWRRLLVRWNAKINMVGASTLEDFWRRHALDSAQLIDLALDDLGQTKHEHEASHALEQKSNKPSGNLGSSQPTSGRLNQKHSSQPTLGSLNQLNCIDMGSGAGFPGLALALMVKARGVEGRVYLIEASAKRAAFLREAVRETGAPAEVICAKIEDVHASLIGNPESPSQPSLRRLNQEGSSQPSLRWLNQEESSQPSLRRLNQPDLITARALAPLPKLLDAASRFWGPDTLGLFPKGREADAEILAAKKRYRFVLCAHPSRAGGEGSVLAISNLTVL